MCPLQVIKFSRQQIFAKDWRSRSSRKIVARENLFYSSVRHDLLLQKLLEVGIHIVPVYVGRC